MFDPYSILRPNILNLIPYSSARDEYSGANAIFIDANENPFDSGMNRYPDPYQIKLRQKVARVKKVLPEQLFLGNGSDEAIDLLIRAFCEPRVDNIVAMKPSYGMYKVCADINNVEFREALLTDQYQLDNQAMLDLVDSSTKMIFLCSPNNPTSNSLNRDDIIYLLEQFKGIVVVDEAYIDFSIRRGILERLNDYPNLVVLQTFSKAWGLAGIRLGMAFASKQIIEVLNKIKYPYNINVLTQKTALEILEKEAEKELQVDSIIRERITLIRELNRLDLVKEILPSDANFLMIRVPEARKIYQYLIDKNIIVRDRSKVPLCEGCLRITVGTPEENETLIKALAEYRY